MWKPRPQFFDGFIFILQMTQEAWNAFAMYFSYVLHGAKQIILYLFGTKCIVYNMCWEEIIQGESKVRDLDLSFSKDD